MTTDYISALDELNMMLSACEKVSADADEMSQVLENALTQAYMYGTALVGQMLDTKVNADEEEMDEVIWLMIEDETFEDRVRKHAEEGTSQRTLWESEFHRVWTQAMQNGAGKVSGKSGKPVTKTWRTMLDNRVRDTHDYLEGMTIPIEDEFYTFDGDHALAPGYFQNVSNNANCRCILSYRFA